MCPSSYDLGEDAKIVLLSTTEGEDKPLKYPSIFFKSELMLLTKVDLLPYVPFSAELARKARRVNPEMEISTSRARLAKVWIAGWSGCFADSRRNIWLPRLKQEPSEFWPRVVNQFLNQPEDRLAG